MDPGDVELIGRNDLDFARSIRYKVSPSVGMTSLVSLPMSLVSGEGELALGPLLSVQTCVECGEPAAFFFSKYRSRNARATLLEYWRGHNGEREKWDQVAALEKHLRPGYEFQRQMYDTGELLEGVATVFREFDRDYVRPAYLLDALRRHVEAEAKRGYVLLGGPGTGKTHLAVALAAEACRRNKKVRFCRVSELVTQLVEAREERALGRLRAQLGRLEVLVLDGLGYVPASQVGAELLFDVISAAYERTSVIVTTDLPLERWTEVLGGERLVGATLGRLTHRCHILEATGESYRLEEARRRKTEKEHA